MSKVPGITTFSVIETLSQRAGSFLIASVSTMVRTCTRRPFHEPAKVTTPATPSETLAASGMTARTTAAAAASAVEA
ncbi:hypothetical protein [Mesorhizobium sp. M0213]|uniref:hypothetical protein n=1 Tax=Mesorhizobium sp. M0213 TaxID=2956917 RepID=UPI00333CC1F1